MDVFLQGKQKVTLTRAEFKAQGGEGSVYVKGQTAYKVYADPARMIPAAKIAELSTLTLSQIVRPQQILTDKAQIPVGYTMACIPDAVPLCQTFAQAFRDRRGLSPDKMLRLVRALQTGVAHVHAQGLLLVDLNETNFLVDPAFEHVFFIDVDSYQSPSFPATALMESVRDRHAQSFSAESDWFSFAVVSFQMFVGLHPYRGKHPTLATLDERMLANISALRPEVTIPNACLPFDVIPDAYRRWYRAVLDQGLRCPPPDRLDSVLVLPPVVKRQAGSRLFDIEELQEFPGDVLHYAHGLAVTTQGVMLADGPLLSADVKIGLVPQTGHAVAAWLDRGQVRLFDLTRRAPLAADIRGDELMATEGRLYVRQGASLLEIAFLPLPAATLVTATLAAQVLPQATQLFEGVAFQNMLGAWYAVLLPERGRARPVRLPELDGCQIVDAKYQNRVLLLTVTRQGRYDRLLLRFDKSHQSYDLRRADDVPTPGVNFVGLDTGVCLHLTDSDELEVFSHRIGDSALKVLSDLALGGDCRLFKNGAQALFARGRSLFKIKSRTTE